MTAPCGQVMTRTGIVEQQRSTQPTNGTSGPWTRRRDDRHRSGINTATTDGGPLCEREEPQQHDVGDRHDCHHAKPGRKPCTPANEAGRPGDGHQTEAHCRDEYELGHSNVGHLTSSHHGAWMLACVPMTLRTLLGIEHPIIQAPMAGVQGSALAIAVSNAGGLGSLPCALLRPAAMRDELERIRAATTKPYNVNFFCHQPPVPDARRDAAWKAAMTP